MFRVQQGLKKGDCPNRLETGGLQLKAQAPEYRPRGITEHEGRSALKIGVLDTCSAKEIII